MFIGAHCVRVKDKKRKELIEVYIIIDHIKDLSLRYDYYDVIQI